jgi:hypothetical protein
MKLKKCISLLLIFMVITMSIVTTERQARATTGLIGAILDIFVSASAAAGIEYASKEVASGALAHFQTQYPDAYNDMANNLNYYQKGTRVALHVAVGGALYNFGNWWKYMIGQSNPPTESWTMTSDQTLALSGEATSLGTSIDGQVASCAIWDPAITYVIPESGTGEEFLTVSFYGVNTYGVPLTAHHIDVARTGSNGLTFFYDDVSKGAFNDGTCYQTSTNGGTLYVTGLRIALKAWSDKTMKMSIMNQYGGLVGDIPDCAYNAGICGMSASSIATTAVNCTTTAETSGTSEAGSEGVSVKDSLHDASNEMVNIKTTEEVIADNTGETADNLGATNDILNVIKNSISEWPETISNTLTGIGTSISGYVDTIGAKITDVYNGVCAIPGSIATTFTDVLTNIKTSTTTIADELTGEWEPIDYTPLQMAGSAITTKFPFSLPWDIANGITGMQGDNSAPTWTIQFPACMNNYQMVINLSMFDSIMPAVRGMELILFTFGLVIATRRLLGGDV